MRPGELNPFHRQLLTRYLRNVAVALAVLLSVLAVFGLSAAMDREADGGWSTWQVMRPLIVVALAATVSVAALQFAGWSSPPGDVGAGSAGTLPTGAPPTLEAQTAFHARNAYPLLCLLVVLTAIPLAATRRRVSVYSGFGMAFALIVAYNIIAATAQAFGRHRGLPPAVAGWTGPVVLATYARFLWIKEKL